MSFRNKYNELIECLEKSPKISESGVLNYLITCLVKQYLKDNHEKYSTYNDIIGALENCKLELYRRMIASYEDQKINDNSDVY